MQLCVLTDAPPQVTVMVEVWRSHAPVHPVRATVPSSSAAPLKLPSLSRIVSPFTAPALLPLGLETKRAAHASLVLRMHWGALVLRSPHPRPLAVIAS